MAVSFPSGSLVRRELLTTLRRPSVFFFMGLFTVGCVIAALSQWPSPKQLLWGGTRVSENLLSMIALSLLAGAGLFIPGLAGSALSLEREQETYDQLHLTLISPWGMLFGKLANVLGVFTLLAVAAMPVLGVVFFLVGISWGTVLGSLFIVYINAFSCACGGLFCSAFFRRTIVAMMASYIAGAIVYGFHWLLLILLLEMGSDALFGYGIVYSFFDAIGERIADLWSAVERTLFLGRLFPRGSTEENLALVFTPAGVVSSGPGGMQPAHYFCATLYQLLIAAGFLFGAHRILLRPPITTAAAPKAVIDDAAVLNARRKRFPYYLIDPLRRKQAIEDGRNPMFVRELRWGMLGRMDVLVRVFYAAVAVEMLLGTMCMVSLTGTRTGEGMAGAMVCLTVLTCLAAPALMANTFTKELEQGNFDMLRMTLLPSRAIFLGKLSAGLVSLAPLFLAAVAVGTCFAGVTAIGWHEPENVRVYIEGLVTLTVCALLTMTLSLAASSHMRTTARALVLSYALNLFFFGGLFVIAYGIWHNFFVVTHPQYETWHWRYTTMPYTSGAYITYACSPIFAYMKIHLLGARVDEAARLFWVASTAAFSLSGLLILLGAMRRFKTQRMRD